jgi:hypothetical protein|eukprot:scaffold1494_cov290-Chaetoceros_neogracile.AAC.18
MNCDAQVEGGRMMLMIVFFTDQHLLQLSFLYAGNKNNHAAIMLPVRAECNELTTSRRKGAVPFNNPRHIPELLEKTASLQSAFKSSHPQFLVVSISLQSDF